MAILIPDLIWQQKKDNNKKDPYYKKDNIRKCLDILWQIILAFYAHIFQTLFTVKQPTDDEMFLAFRPPNFCI